MFQTLPCCERTVTISFMFMMNTDRAIMLSGTDLQFLWKFGLHVYISVCM